MFDEDSPSSLQWKDGLASFNGALINSAGEYKLNFTTDLDLPGSRQCFSDLISIEIGEPYELIILDEPKVRVYGGKTFETQPRILIVDKGGNALKMDSSSKVVVSLYSNPSNSSLSPLINTVAMPSQGIVQFKHLRINKAGVGFMFMYELFINSKTESGLFRTNITTLGKTVQ